MAKLICLDYVKEQFGGILYSWHDESGNCSLQHVKVFYARVTFLFFSGLETCFKPCSDFFLLRWVRLSSHSNSNSLVDFFLKGKIYQRYFSDYNLKLS